MSDPERRPGGCCEVRGARDPTAEAADCHVTEEVR